MSGLGRLVARGGAARVGASGATAAVVPVAGLVVGWLATRLGVSIARRAWVVPIGVGAVIACVLIGVTPQGAITVVIAALLGLGHRPRRA